MPIDNDSYNQSCMVLVMKFWTRRSFLSASTATLAATKLTAAPPSTDAFVYIGSSAKGDGEGIHVGKWNAGTLSDVRLAFPANSPSFQVGGGNHGTRFLFSGHQPQPTLAALSSFRVEASGDLKVINTVTVADLEESMIQIVLDHTQRCLFSASYRSGKVFSFKVAPDGHLSDPVSQFQLSGHGPNARRQSTAHAHGAVISPENRFVLVNDLGTDRIMVYKLNASTAELAPNDPPFYSAAPGSGPRHLAFHPNGKWAYGINELDSTLTFLSWNAKTGVLITVANTSTLPPGADVAKNRAGEVIIDKGGRFLYACNRGPAEELLVYAIEPMGRLTLAGRTPLGGKEARHFALAPGGNFFVVAEQFTNQVSVFTRDRATGLLAATGNKYPVNKASCIVFV
jgi:6-phosphogluconolactonase